MNVKRFIHIWTIAILFLLFDVNIAKAASSCPLDSVLTFNVDSVLTEVTIYDYVVDTPRTTVWTVNPGGTRVGKSREESYSSSLKTMTASYVWDNSAHNWKGTEKEEKTYKYFGGAKKEISHTTFKWINAKWVADTRETSNFDDAAREIEHFEYTRNTTTNQLQPISGYVYAWIDDTQKSLEIQYTAYGTNAWSTGTKQEWAFDDEGRPTLVASSTMTNGTWIGTAKETWAYEGPAGQQTLHETYGWYNSDWSMTLREIAAFDTEGRQTLIENYTGENGVVTGTQKEEYAFDGENITLTIKYKWSATKKDWIGLSNERWEFNGPTGEKTYYEKQVWRNSAWGDSIQETWEYNGPSNKLTYHVKYVWNKDLAALRKTLENTTEYDGTNVIRIENYALENDVWTGKKKVLTTYTNGKKTQVLTYAWENGAWVDGNKEVWEYNGPSSKQTLHEKYEYTNGGWLLVLQETTGYSGNNIALKMNYELIGGIWTGTMRETYSYNGSTKIQTIVFAWENGAWVNSTKENWGYTNSKLTLHEFYEWTGAWTKTLQENTGYSGNVITWVTNYALIEGVWTGTKKEVYTYTDGQKTREMIYQWYGNDWMYQTKEEWTFESGHLTLHEKAGWDGTQWIDMKREIAGFDEAGNQILVENYALMNTTGWTGLKKEEYAFEGSTKTTTVIYAWADNAWTPSTKNEIGYQDGNTEVSEANYTWSNNTWTGSGNRTYTTKDSENRVVELLTQNWPDGATEWTNASIATHTFDTAGDDILTYNGTWNGTRWAVSSMTRLDKIIDEKDRQLLKASWKCASDSIWIGVEKDTAKYSATDKLLYRAKYKGWKNNDWIPVSKTENNYDSEDRTLYEQSYKWSNNKWQGVYRYEYAYDEQGRRTANITYSGWNNTTNSWKGSSKQECVYYKDYTNKYESMTTYSWKNNQWNPSSRNTYSYDSSDREIEQIEQGYSTKSQKWINVSKYTKEYSGSKLVIDNEYDWENNQWIIRSQKELYYDEDAQAKLRREIIGSWTSAVLKSYEDKQYNYACDLRTIRFVNYDGTLLEEQKLAKGVTPVYSGETPTKTDETSTYVFIGWTPTVVAVNGDATYTATYSASLNQYTVTFKDEDGTTLSSQTLYHGSTPTCAEPTKTATAEYTYTFGGWSPEITTVTADITYTATYNATKNKYTISWFNDDDSQIDQTSVEYGIVPSHANPTKQATAEYSYAFSGWSPELVAVTGNTSYKATFEATKKSYTITWLNEDNSSLGTTTVEYGVVPTHEEPTKTNTAQYTYAFVGWTPTPAAVVGEATYTASFSETLNRYTVTFKDDQDNTLDSRLWDYGLTPTCTPPTKEPDAENTYAFAGWSPEVTTVQADITYTAVFDAIQNSYTITWLNDDDSQIDQTTVNYGALPTHDDPVKTNTAEYTYSFSGWTPNIIAATAEASYKATFTATKNKYTITWLNDDNSQIDQTSVEYGVVPTHDDPAKTATAEWSYTFAGWDNTPIAVTGEATYKATYTSSKNSYTITWLDDDNTQIDQTSVEYGVVPTHVDPTKQATAEFTYTFAGWDNTPIAVTGEATYKATYTSTKNSYTVTWLDDDNSALGSTTVEYGVVPTHEDPTKQPTAQYGYTFAGWTPAISAVTGNATYKAMYTDTINQYTISWLDDVGTLVDQTKVAYGSTPAHANIYKESDDQYDYTFVGWTPTLVPVIGDASYSAIFTTAGKSYTVTFYFEDGVTVLDQMTLPYGAIPSTQYIPSIPSDANHTYTFSGWSPEIAPVTGDISYVPTFTAIPNQYTVIFRNYNGKELQRKKVDYGTIPEYEGDEPSRPATNSYTWAFEGWTPELVAVIGDATYTAVYTKVMNTYTILFYDEDGITLLDEVTVEHGQKPTTSVVPTKEADEEYRYTFAGWSPKIAKATADAEYTATYMATPKTQDLNNTEAEERATKVLIDDHIYILRSGHTYTLDGALVK